VYVEGRGGEGRWQRGIEPLRNLAGGVLSPSRNFADLSIV
jgi:hypothetical protein